MINKVELLISLAFAERVIASNNLEDTKATSLLNGDLFDLVHNENEVYADYANEICKEFDSLRECVSEVVSGGYMCDLEEISPSIFLNNQDATGHCQKKLDLLVGYLTQATHFAYQTHGHASFSIVTFNHSSDDIVIALLEGNTFFKVLCTETTISESLKANGPTPHIYTFSLLLDGYIPNEAG